MFQGAMCHCMNNFASQSVYHQHRYMIQIARRFSQSLVSLSSDVFERRTSTGSGLFASLGSGLVETLG